MFALVMRKKMIKLIIKFLGISRDLSDAMDQYGKRWWTSSTIWINTVALIALGVNYKVGSNTIADDQQTVIVGGILAIVNILQRLKTSQPVVLKEEDIKDLTAKKEIEVGRETESINSN